MEHSLEVFPIQRNLHFLQRSGNFQLLQKGFQLPGPLPVLVHRQLNQNAIGHHTAMEKFFLNLDRYGNTSAASIPIALDEMAGQGLLARGQDFICVGFGAGLTWGGALLRW